MNQTQYKAEHSAFKNDQTDKVESPFVPSSYLNSKNSKSNNHSALEEESSKKRQRPSPFNDSASKSINDVTNDRSVHDKSKSMLPFGYDENITDVDMPNMALQDCDMTQHEDT